MAKVSVLIPSRNERFLPETVRDVLTLARGDIECVVCLDGYWPTPPLPADPRLKILHRGTPLGMRQGINGMAAMATGEYLMKLDAHCALQEGYDLTLQAECDDDWVVVPRRDRLDPIRWTAQDPLKNPYDAHFLSYPFERPDDPSCGLHGTAWLKRGGQRRHVLLDEEMSSQGSCWFMRKTYWESTIGPLDWVNYGSFIQEFQEIGLRAWLSGGKVMVNKKTTYLHLHKGKAYGRGYSLSGSEQMRGRDYCTRYWMLDSWPRAIHPLRWLIERFWPVPTWPQDLDLAFAEARKRLGVA